MTDATIDDTIWKPKAVVIVTGASRGFGRAIARAIGRSMNGTGTLSFHLFSRSRSDLEETKSILIADGCECTEVFLHVCDLGNLSAMETRIRPIFCQIHDNGYWDRAILLNNAASLGSLDYVEKYKDSVSPTFISEYMNVNVSSPMWLCKEFLQTVCKRTRMTDRYPKSSAIINISSLAAIQPFESWAMYCTGKAARDMFHQVLAKELKLDEKGRPLVKTLNYAPGPLDTDMQLAIRESDTVHAPTREYFINAFENNKLVDPNHSAEKLARLINADTYVSGSHVDFFDED